MHYKKGEPIGHVDDIGQEILCGDVIFDGTGRRYAINEKGQAETEGGGIFDVKKLKEVVISRPTKEGGQTPPPTAPGRKNESGLVQLKNLPPIRKKLITAAEARSAIREAGITILNSKNGSPCIVELDKQKAMDAIEKRLAQGEPKEVLPGFKNEPERVPGKDYIPVDWVDACDRGGIWRIVRVDEMRGIEDAEDKDLAEELRRRGYTVTATKMVEL